MLIARSAGGVVGVMSLRAAAATLQVAQDGSGDEVSVMDAVLAAEPGDTILVAAGTYVGDVDYLGKNLVIEGEGADLVTLVGTGVGPVVRFVTGEGPSATLRGLTVTGGDGSGLGELPGGCVQVSSASPTLEFLVLEGCQAHLGGGIQLLDSMSTLTDVVIRQNAATLDADGDWGYGGGLYAAESDLQLTGLVIEDNTAPRGGGLMGGDSILSLDGGTLRDNESERGGAASLLGGVASWTGTEVEGNLATIHSGGVFANLGAVLNWDGGGLFGNSAPEGGGIRAHGASVVLSGLDVQGNEASGSGGALKAEEGATVTITTSTFGQNHAAHGGALLATASSVVAQSCTWAGNIATSSGGAIYLHDSSTDLRGHLFSDNTAGEDGGAVRLDGAGDHALRNNVFVDNNAGNGGALHLFGGATAEVFHNSFAGNSAVSGGTVRATAGSGITFVHNILAFPSAGTGLSVADGALWEVGWNNLWHPTGAEYGDAIADQTGISGNLHADPLFLLYTADATWNDDLHLRADSPCIDAGDPTRGLDPDGSPPDLGAFGGPDATLWPVIDLDGDGWPDGVLDCDDGRADVHPGAPEECDGVDQDCDGQVDDGCGDDDDDSAVGDDDSAGDDDLVGDDDVGDDDISLRTPETGGCGCEGEDGGAALALPLLLGAFRPKRRHR